MKTFLPILLLITIRSVCLGEPVASAPSGRFHIEQSYSEPWSERVVFQNEKSAVILAGFIWPGIYSISPDEKWILRTQKVGSGDNIAILYHVERNGRIMEVVNFDELLWSSADKTSPIKKAKLYHTGISEFKWSKDYSGLLITLKGSNVEKSGSGIKLRLRYNLTKHSISPVDN